MTRGSDLEKITEASVPLRHSRPGCMLCAAHPTSTTVSITGWSNSDTISTRVQEQKLLHQKVAKGASEHPEYYDLVTACPSITACSSPKVTRPQTSSAAA